MRSDVIKRVQLSLQMLGYYNGTIDGVMGNDMRKALINYRVDKGLPIVDGIDAEALNSLGISAP